MLLWLITTLLDYTTCISFGWLYNSIIANCNRNHWTIIYYIAVVCFFCCLMSDVRCVFCCHITSVWLDSLVIVELHSMVQRQRPVVLYIQYQIFEHGYVLFHILFYILIIIIVTTWIRTRCGIWTCYRRCCFVTWIHHYINKI